MQHSEWSVKILEGLKVGQQEVNGEWERNQKNFWEESLEERWELAIWNRSLGGRGNSVSKGFGMQWVRETFGEI